ncbi:LysR family transcriptional regulator [Caryophanon tenue]|nr:LysR family transcriptional regulator [Caryophanon tenue]
MMDERDYEILLELYKTKNISKAADNLYVSQPSLTYRIKQIEKKINYPIIIRGVKGIDFTNEGERLITYVLQQRQHYEEFITSLQQNSGEIGGTLKLGVSGMYARYALPAVLAEFHQLYPQVEIDLVTGWSNEVNKMVLNEQVHIGIVRGDYNPTGQRLLLRRDQLYIVSRELITFEALPHLPAILYATDISLKATIEQWWKENFRKPQKVSIRTDRSETCLEMVKSALGYAILPEICLTDTELYHVPLHDKAGNPIYRDTWLTYTAHANHLKQATKFVEFLTTP